MSCGIALWSYYIVFQVGPITFFQLKIWCLQQWPVEIQLLSKRLLSSSFFFSCVGTMARPANLWRCYLLCLWKLLWRSTNNLLPLGSNQILGLIYREFPRSGLSLWGFSQQQNLYHTQPYLLHYQDRLPLLPVPLATEV